MGSCGRVAAGLAAVGSLAVAGCGGSRQDAHERAGTYRVDVVKASFPTKQALAEPTAMEITVRNTGSEAIPDIAVTVGGRGKDGFSRVSEQSGLSDASRPVWILDSEPKGGGTAYVSTWALGRLGAGKSATFRWRMTPQVPGSHKVSYRIAAGLNGKARARLAGGGLPQGSFAVDVSDVPSQASVDPDTGAVVHGG